MKIAVTTDIDRTVAEIVEYSKIWRDIERENTALTNRAKAICRRYVSSGDLDYDDEKDRAKIVRLAGALHKQVVAGETNNVGLKMIVDTFEVARQPLEASRKIVEDQITALVKSLPAWRDWAKDVKGIGPVWFGLIVGCAGNLSNYGRISRLYKRMGLAVIDGERQRRCSDVEKAIAHGYSPQRRSTVWMVGNGLIGGMGNGPRPVVDEDIEERDDLTEYQKMFIRELRAQPDDRLPDTAEGKESYKKRAAARAKRMVEKQFLRDMWRIWKYGVDGTVVD